LRDSVSFTLQLLIWLTHRDAGRRILWRDLGRRIALLDSMREFVGQQRASGCGAWLIQASLKKDVLATGKRGGLQFTGGVCRLAIRVHPYWTEISVKRASHLGACAGRQGLSTSTIGQRRLRGRARFRLASGPTLGRDEMAKRIIAGSTLQRLPWLWVSLWCYRQVTH
jgi:hypothetical protein